MEPAIQQRFSVGIGTTSRCNLNCPHCYSRGQGDCDISLFQIERLLVSAPITSVNFGTGENGLHPQFFQILSAVESRSIPASITSNGFTIGLLPYELMRGLHDVDISIDFATEKAHDAFRGTGVWASAIKAIERCKQLEVKVSIVTTLMNVNYHEIKPLLSLARTHGIALRINLYKPVHSFEYSLSYEQFWDAIAILFDNSQLVVCSEPIINAFITSECKQQGISCGKHSIRVWPDGKIVPCVYWNRSDITLDDFLVDPSILQTSQEFKSAMLIPDFCTNCEFVATCRGGCPATRLHYSSLTKPDPYCPIANGRDQPKLSPQKSSSSFEYVHGSYLCTMIVNP